MGRINWVSHGIHYTPKLAETAAAYNAAGGRLKSVCVCVAALPPIGAI